MGIVRRPSGLVDIACHLFRTKVNNMGKTHDLAIDRIKSNVMSSQHRLKGLHHCSIACGVIQSEMPNLGRNIRDVHHD
jgi:hypothetical protein